MVTYSKNGLLCIAASLIVLTSGVSAVASAETVGACVGGRRDGGFLRDPILDRAWKLEVDCAHPERPRAAVDLGMSSNKGSSVVSAQRLSSVRFAARVPPAVVAGEKIRAGRHDAHVRIELEGTALDSGVPGAMIRFRTENGNAILRGTVQGAGQVELAAGQARGSLEAWR